MSLTIVPVTFRVACRFIVEHHRHHKPPRGMRFAIGVADADGVLRGVLTAGRPVARAYDNGLTLEVNRTCTDGYRNVNSMLYGAAVRAALALGYRRVITYTQSGESGASLRGAGWRVIAERPARKSWTDSSVALRHLRDPKGNGGIQRSLWEACV